jgi:hypothetical protein
MATTLTRFDSSEFNEKRMKVLHSLLWNLCSDTIYGEMYMPANLKLPKELYKKILEVIRIQELPCEIKPSAYGNVNLVIYGHSPALGIKPEMLLCLSLVHHLPIRVRLYFKNTPKAARLYFGPLVHNPRNLQLLEFYGLEKPKEWSHYSY